VRGATRLQRRRQCAAGIENEQVTFAQEFGKLLELRMLHSAALPIDHKQPHFVATKATTFRRLLCVQLSWERESERGGHLSCHPERSFAEQNAVEGPQAIVARF
jgi:hypothetical protein